METIKKYLDTIFGGIVLLLGGLLFRQTKKTEQLESQIATAKNETLTKENDNAVKAQDLVTDSAVDEFRKLDK